MAWSNECKSVTRSFFFIPAFSIPEMRAEMEDSSCRSKSEYAFAASFWILSVKSDIDSPDFCFSEDIDERRIRVSVAGNRTSS